MEEKFGIAPRLIKGRDGVFEVMLGDHLVYSKMETGRFPEPGEVETAIEPLLAS